VTMATVREEALRISRLPIPEGAAEWERLRDETLALPDGDEKTSRLAFNALLATELRRLAMPMLKARPPGC